jgi:hypothetical protein
MLAAPAEVYNARRVMGPGPRAPAPAEASGARHHAAAGCPQRPGRLRLHAKEHPHNAARGTTARYSARFGTALQHCSAMPRVRGSAPPSVLLRVFVPSCLVCWIMSAAHTSARTCTPACTRPHIAAASASTLAWLPHAWTCGERGDLPGAAAWAGGRQSPAYSFPEDCVAIASPHSKWPE